MKHILALDTGGTKCESILFTEDGDVVGSGYCIGKSIETTQSKAGSGRSQQCMAVSAGEALAGVAYTDLLVANTKSGPLQLADFGDVTPEYVFFDEGNSALALVGEDYGIVVLAGTGAMVMAKAADDRYLWLDGLGPLLGDYGSASHIGYMALRAACKSQWHPRHATTLGKAVRLQLGGREDDPRGGSLIEFSFSQYDRADIAGLSKIVNEAADAGDAIAQDILREAAEALAGTVFDVVDRLDLTVGDYALVGTGGMLSRSPSYWRQVCENVAKFAPNLRPVISDLRPVVGIGIKALQKTFPDDWRPRADRLRESARARSITH